MIWSMKILMEDLNVKETLLRVLLMRVGFGAPSVDGHDGLIGPFGLIFVDMHHDGENVGRMGGIHRVDGYVVGCEIFRMIFCYFLPESKSLSF